MTEENPENGAPPETNDNLPAGEAAPQVNGAPAANVRREVTFEDVIGWCQHPLTMLCKGMYASASNLPIEAVMMAMAAAMGRVMSEGTASDVPAATIAIRAKVKQQFEQNLAKHMPAFRAPGTMPIMQPLKGH